MKVFDGEVCLGCWDRQEVQIPCSQVLNSVRSFIADSAVLSTLTVRCWWEYQTVRKTTVYSSSSAEEKKSKSLTHRV